MLFVTNKALVKGVRTQDPEALTYLYKKVFPRVFKIIEKSGGGYDIAKDIFQEAIIVIFRKARKRTLPKKIKVENYLIGICKLIWKNEHRNETLKTIDIQIEDDELDKIDEAESDLLQVYLESQRMKLYTEHFNQLQDDCRAVLMAFFRGTSFADIAKELGMISEEYARRKKYLCKEYLVKSIKNDPMFSKLIGEYDDGLFE